MIRGQDNFAGEKVFEYFRLMMICGQAILQAKKTLNISRLLMICGQDNSAGEKIFEFFQVVDDLRLRELCRRKSVGIFPGCWWFAAKTILQVKKSLNVFGILMICGQDNFAREKSLRIFPSCWWFAAKGILQVKNSLNIFRVRMMCG